MTEQLNRIDGDIAEIKDDIVEVKEKVAGHEIRFDNGRKIMGDIKADLNALKPKAPDWLKLLLAGLTIIGILMGGQLWLTDRFNDRPTKKALEKRINPIKVSQEKTSKEIRGIRDEQIEQRTLINHVKETQDKQDEKLSDILDRLPKHSTRR